MPELSDRQRRKAEKAAKISGKHGSGDSSDGFVFEICKIVVMVFIAVIVALGAAAFKQGTLLPQVFEKRAPSAPVPIDCSPDCANGGRAIRWSANASARARGPDLLVRK